MPQALWHRLRNQTTASVSNSGGARSKMFFFPKIGSQQNVLNPSFLGNRIYEFVPPREIQFAYVNGTTTYELSYVHSNIRACFVLG